MADVAWTAEQAAAITSRRDTLLVANAGTGKTTTVVGKVLWQLGLDVGREESGRPIAPCPDPCQLHEIAAVTFTEKAAYDLKRKLRKEIAGSERGDELRWELDRATIGTIHAFCGSLLREHALRLGVDPTFRVMDEAEARPELDEVVREVLIEALEADDEAVGELFRGRGLRRFKGGGLLSLVAGAMTDLRWHPEAYEPWRDGEGVSLSRIRQACEAWSDGDEEAVRHCSTLLRLGRRALQRWEAFLREENARDFDAMILDVRRLLLGSEGAAALGELRRRYRLIIIDEFQDTDGAQRDIVQAIGRGPAAPQLFLVGDPKQSIYRFRGADVSVWNEVEREVEREGTILRLTRNFRSTPAVLDFANCAGGRAIEETGEALAREFPGGRVAYSDLEMGRVDADRGSVEWIAATAGRADARRRAEARAVVGRIQELVGQVAIPDPGTGQRRPLAYRDVALLYRTNTGIPLYEEVLRRHGVPFHNAQPPALGDRQEVADLLNALRLVENPRDDLRAFAFLRSPFVGLRDEVLARMRLADPKASFLRQAHRCLEEDEEGYVPPEHPRIPEVERTALRRGLEALEEVRALAGRVPLDELGRMLLRRTGYLAHLVVLDRHQEAVAHLQSFLRQLEAHRHLLLGRFLDVWDRREEADHGLPSAPLHSREDDVVTFTTMHRAKGLEWPVVFLIDVCDWDEDERSSGSLMRDRDLGPVFMPNKDDRGARARRICDRSALEAAAEEARVLYVALTRARERLVVVSGHSVKKRLSRILVDAMGEGVTVRPVPEPAEPAQVGVEPRLEWLGAGGGGVSKEELPGLGAPGLESPDEETAGGDVPALVRPLPRPARRATTSATELMMKVREPERWEMRYVHGVQPAWEFAPQRKREAAGGLPARVRGDVIHGVLERIREANELAALLEETIGELDNPEYEAHLSRGSRYREALEAEIRRVVEGEEWRWYVEGEHYRELPFVHLEERPWRLGSFDLYRPREGRSWIIDFKTHQIGAEEVERVAGEYAVQVEVYTAAAAVRGPVRMRLHFTWPNSVVEV